MFIEEGRYKDIETFNIPTSPKSIRLVKDDMGSPELYLASSTNYEGMKSGGHLGVIWRSSGVPKVSQKSPKGWIPDLGRSELRRVISYAFLSLSIDFRL